MLKFCIHRKNSKDKLHKNEYFMLFYTAIFHYYCVYHCIYHAIIISLMIEKLNKI